MNRGLPVLVLLALLLVSSAAPMSSAEEAPILIDSMEMFCEIGRSLPSDGDYVQTEDICASVPGLPCTLSVSSGPDAVLELSADGALSDFRVYAGGIAVDSDSGRACLPADRLEDCGIVLVSSDAGAAVFRLDGPGTYFGTLQEMRNSLAGGFSGSYDGRGHAITGFCVIGEGSSGLFAGLDGARILDLELDGTCVSLSRTEHIGAVYDTGSCTGLLSPSADGSRMIRVAASGLSASFCDAESSIDGASISSDADRHACSGGLIGDSSGCEYLACASSVTALSSCTSSLTAASEGCDAVLGKDASTPYLSESLAGGIACMSRGDDFLFSSSFSDLCAYTGDWISVPHPGTGAYVGPDSMSWMGGCCAVSDSSVFFGCTADCDWRQTGSFEGAVGIGAPAGTDVLTCGGLSGRAVSSSAESCLISSDIGRDGDRLSPGSDMVGGIFGQTGSSDAKRCILNGAYLSGRCGSASSGGFAQEDCLLSESATPGFGNTEGLLTVPDAAAHEKGTYRVLSGGEWTWDTEDSVPVPSCTFRAEFRPSDDKKDYMTAGFADAIDVRDRFVTFGHTLPEEPPILAEGCTAELTEDGMRVLPVFDRGTMSFEDAVISTEPEPEDRTAYIAAAVFGAVAVLAGAALIFNIRSLLVL